MKSTHDIVIDWIAGLTTRRGEAIHAHTELIGDGILDSLAVLNLVGFLEEHFNIMLPVEEFLHAVSDCRACDSARGGSMSHERQADVLIVGGGPAGSRAAFGLAKRGYD